MFNGKVALVTGAERGSAGQSRCRWPEVALRGVDSDLRKSWLDVVKSDVGGRAGKRQTVSPRCWLRRPSRSRGEAADLTRGARQARTKNRRSSGSCLTYFRRSETWNLIRIAGVSPVGSRLSPGRVG